jgi:hypothetical protein
MLEISRVSYNAVELPVAMDGGESVFDAHKHLPAEDSAIGIVAPAQWVSRPDSWKCLKR